MSRRQPILYILLAAALIVGACTIEGPAGPTININNINTNTITLAPITGSGESKGAGCPEIARLQINYPTLLAIGASACDEADGVSISSTPSDLLSVEDPASFTTSLKGLKAGDATVSVTVNKARSTVRVTVK